MKTLDRYIATRFMLGFLLVIFILMALFSFLELVGQLDDIGKGHYFLKDAMVYVALTLPRRTLDLIPVGTLLGSIIALGVMSDNNELLAMQAAGVSVLRICWSVLAAGLVLTLFTAVLAEFVVPPMERQARAKRSLALSDPEVTVTKEGFWARHGLSFIHVRKPLYGGTAVDIDIYECDENWHLRTFSHARRADIRTDKQWLLSDIDQKIIGPGGITFRHLPDLSLNAFLSPKQVNVLELPPDSMSTAELFQFVSALNATGQNAEQYVLALWRKLSVPLSTGAMVLLSLSFVFGSSREITAGQRILLGTIVGVVIYLGNQIIGYLGLMYGLQAALTTLTPVAVILTVAFWLLRNVIK